MYNPEYIQFFRLKDHDFGFYDVKLLVQVATQTQNPAKELEKGFGTISKGFTDCKKLSCSCLSAEQLLLEF